MEVFIRAFFEEAAKHIPEGWSKDQKAFELAQMAVETIATLPELDIGDGHGVPQGEFDAAVEEAHTFFKGEALSFLES